MTTTAKLRGFNLIDRCIDRANAGEKLSLREWLVLNLEACASMRDSFVKFCRTNGISQRSRFKVEIWRAIWGGAADEYSKWHKSAQEEHLRRVPESLRKQETIYADSSPRVNPSRGRA